MREADGRDAEPTACVLDAQSVKTSANVPAAGQGIDAGKKIAGRKRHIGVDTLSLLLAVWVTAASVSDNAGGIHLLSNLAEAHPHITKAWADTDYRAKAIDHGATLGIDVEIARRDAGQKDSRSSLGVGSSSGPSAGSELARRIAHPRRCLSSEASAFVKAAEGPGFISGIGEVRKVHIGDAEVG